MLSNIRIHKATTQYTASSNKAASVIGPEGFSRTEGSTVVNPVFFSTWSCPSVAGGFKVLCCIPTWALKGDS